MDVGDALRGWRARLERQVPAEEPVLDDAEARRARYKLRWALMPKAMALAGIPESILMDGPDMTKVPADLAARLREGLGGESFFLYGPTGTGKSFAAAALLKLVLRQRIIHLCKTEPLDADDSPERGKVDYDLAARWCPMEGFLSRLKEEMDLDGTKPSGRAWDIASASWLVLDDVGAHRFTDWSRDVVYTILERRHADRLPTVITSNHSIKELSERLGEHEDRLFSRLVGGYTDIHVEGPDRRLPPKEEKRVPRRRATDTPGPAPDGPIVRSWSSVPPADPAGPAPGWDRDPRRR